MKKKKAADIRGSGAVEELAVASPRVAAAHLAIRDFLVAQGGGHLQHVTIQAQTLMRDLGVTFGLYDDEEGQDHIVPFDSYPRVLDAAEWRGISEGVLQRTRIWNAFFKDIYDHQEILKTGIVPFELVYGDPAYQRPAVGLAMPLDTWVHTAAYDLTRMKDGRWVVIQDHVATTTGASYALQARHVLRQVSPELLGTADVLPANDYPTALLEHLRRFARNPSSQSRVVLLSPGQYNRAYYEHAFLARQMGITLVRGGDLIVLNSQVYLKTIGGLEPIDVIHRRVSEAWLDPVTFRQDSIIGVPGLMSCVRNGSVTVTNAIGTGLGNNRGLAAYLPKMAKFYFNEPLKLPTVPRLLCGDTDQRELVLANLADYFIAHISDRDSHLAWRGNQLTAPQADELRQRILAQPAQYIAEPHLPLNQLPIARSSEFAGRHAGLRVFAFGGPRAEVPPLALTRHAREANSPVISTGLGGGIKDTWVLRDPGAPLREAPIVVSSPQRRLRLNSRIADNLYWIGRYAERAENTTRILKVLNQVEAENPARQGERVWTPLWEALARATGHPTHFFKRTSPARHQSASHYLLLDRRNPASVIRCLESCRENARSIRESIPPEVWVVINRLHRTAAAAARADASQVTEAILAFQESVLQQLDELAGACSKNMLRDDGWHFWSMGAHLERGVTTIMVMRQVFLKRQTNGHAEARRDDSHLDALLRMLSCQYAYRSLFQSRPAMHNAARMLLQDGQLPRSVLYCLETIRRGLKSAFGPTAAIGSDLTDPTPLRLCVKLIGDIEFADLSPYFTDKPGTRTPLLRHWLDDLTDRLQSLSVSISDHYLHHQAFNILR
jgi:uncharacterized circularly permuted ATP-grasp superfamily protein/uncharacterized alpha-E superfamily protein